MKGFVLSPTARVDLIGIWNYSTERWGVDQAERYIRAINDALLDIAAGRRTGKPVPEIREGYFRLAVGSHFVFYRATASGSADIVRILHQRMDTPERLVH